ncbi:MAG TPA: acyl-CoA dehydrogenase family protein, partial [Actinomycetota bacterium]|nr:acyl-CoA dehydrogenase family protein [Actinomycetota bacterium]
MQLSLTDEQQAIVDALHDFAVNEVRPAARECEAEGAPIERVAKGLFDMGVASPLPEEFGGQGSFDAVTSVLISEEIAWGDPGVAFGVLQSGLAATIVDALGTDEQRSELLPKLADGGAFATAERDAGADITNLETTHEG